MANAQQCRLEARQCLREADNAVSAETRAFYLGMARTWTMVAEQIESLKYLQNSMQQPGDGLRALEFAGELRH